MFPLLLLALAGVLLVMKSNGKLQVPNFVIYAIAGLALVIWFLPNLSSFLGGNVYTPTPTTNVNSCGCQQGEQTVVRYNPFFGRTRTQNMTCTAALALMADKPRRTSFVGCAAT